MLPQKRIGEAAPIRVVATGAGRCLFQQSVQHASATSSGLLLLPMLLPVVVTSQIGGRYMSVTGRYKLFPVVGAVFMTVGLILLSTMGVGTSRTTTSLYMVLVGIGISCITVVRHPAAQCKS